MGPISACRLCGTVPERADHILLERTRLSTIRSDCFRARVPPPTPAWEVDWLLKFVKDDMVVELEESLEEEEEEEDQD